MTNQLTLCNKVKVQLAELTELIMPSSLSRYRKLDTLQLPHHGKQHFVVPDPVFSLPTLTDMLRWYQQKRRSRASTQHNPQLIPWQTVDTALVNSVTPLQSCVTWLGHVSILVQTAGVRILIDPVFSQRASPLLFAGPKRYTPPPCNIAELPIIDAVLISHNHYDHLDRCSIIALQAHSKPTYYVPLGLAAWFVRAGIPRKQIIELQWWQTVQHTNPQDSSLAVDISFIPAQHWSKRGLFDTNRSLWGGFYIQHAPFSFYFTGDSGYSHWMAEVLQQVKHRYGAPTVAALPIGAYLPRWFMQPQHANPSDAVAMYQMLTPHIAFGVHWGTFVLTDEAIEQPMQDLNTAHQHAHINTDKAGIAIWAIGHTWVM